MRIFKLIRQKLLSRSYTKFSTNLQGNLQLLEGRINNQILEAKGLTLLLLQMTKRKFTYPYNICTFLSRKVIQIKYLLLKNHIYRAKLQQMFNYLNESSQTTHHITKHVLSEKSLRQNHTIQFKRVALITKPSKAKLIQTKLTCDLLWESTYRKV